MTRWCNGEEKEEEEEDEEEERENEEDEEEEREKTRTGCGKDAMFRSWRSGEVFGSVVRCLAWARGLAKGYHQSGRKGKWEAP